MNDPRADVQGPRDSGESCEAPSRCGAWVEVHWQADLPVGAIDRVFLQTDMSCFEGVADESQSIMGERVSPREPRRIATHNVCEGCFYVAMRAVDDDGRELASGRQEFCVDETRDVLVILE